MLTRGFLVRTCNKKSAKLSFYFFTGYQKSKLIENNDEMVSKVRCFIAPKRYLITTKFIYYSYNQQFDYET